MKQTYWIFILIILALTLSACSAGESAQPIPTVVLEGSTVNNSGTQSAVQTSSGGSVAASGIVVPAQEAQLAFALAGNVKEVYVTEGAQVQAGDLLAELDNDLVQIEVDQAQRTVRELTSPAAIAAAEQAVANAQTTFKDAKNKVDSYKYRRGDSETIDYYKAQLVLAQKALDRAQETYNKTNSFSSADPIRAAATTNLYNTQKAYNTALANLNWFTDEPSENDVALANASFDAASAALQEAQWYAAELKGEAIPPEATGAKLAQLQQARDSLKAAQEKLANTQLISPFAGTIISLNIVAGEYVAPGQTIIAISDVTNLLVKTTDLSERDIANIRVGQNVSVFVEALGADISGQVLLISAVADTLGGDVVYKTTITLNELPEGIRAGMSVTVQYEP